MRISKKSLAQINPHVNLEIPQESSFQLPEKIVQFGTGVLLRGLPDYFIDQANKEKIFNGRILVIKSTDKGNPATFEEQDGIYTLCIRGLENGKKVEQVHLNNAISRVLVAHDEWEKILQCASNENMQIIISNTTEVGIQPSDDNIHDSPPPSFPGKLLAFLYARYHAFKGDPDKGMVIIPTELINNNGEALKAILIDLSQQNHLNGSFLTWLTNCNYFCNSLVDRIVPGKLGGEEKNILEQKLGYEDNLMISAEPYRLWAIEYPDEKVKRVLSFATVDKGIILAKDINKQRELKLRLLNGTHTFSCALAYLSGFETVKGAMDNKEMNKYIQNLIMNEIIPAITNENLLVDEALDFANKVLDRFRNPYIVHRWLSIAMQYTSKMKMRSVPLLLAHYQKTKRPPHAMARGLAAYIFFMRSNKSNDGSFYGVFNDKNYSINDDSAEVLYAYWKRYPEGPVEAILCDTRLWGVDLTLLPGLVKTTEKYLLPWTDSK